MNSLLTRNTWRLLSAISALLFAVSTQAASFDCAKASTKVEHIICDTPEISKLDDELRTAYKAAVQDQSKAESIRRAQKLWMKVRNVCADAECVKRAYEPRLTLMVAAANQGESDNLAEQEYFFSLTKGKGIDVCEAYLERLNKTEYEKPPYCDRPEDDSVSGFSKLNRLPLLARDVRDLYPVLVGYYHTANSERFNWHDPKIQEEFALPGRQFVLSEEGVKSVQQDMAEGWTKVWRYDPLVDIDNDGVPDNVEVWHGYPLGGAGSQCGGYVYKFPNEPLRMPQIAFAVTADGRRLDIVETEKMFAHPTGGYRFFSRQDKKWKISDNFRAIGERMGIFKFRELYYFDTFFDGWGDFEGKRRSEGTSHKEKNIVNTLAVFLHKDGKTKQICEYLMTDNETQNQGRTR